MVSLFLGLKGTISELELHTIRSRLTAGLLAKVERGELALSLPGGLARDPTGVVVRDPDMAVQEHLGLVFEMFLKFRTAAKVMRVLDERGLHLPRRHRHGDLCWGRAVSSVVSILKKNPAYAGAFVYGWTRMRAAGRESHLRRAIKLARVLDEGVEAGVKQQILKPFVKSVTRGARQFRNSDHVKTKLLCAPASRRIAIGHILFEPR